MSLKCHSCGNEYHYDMKICPNCEEDAINSGLIPLDGLSNNWKCDIFLEVNNLTFGAQNNNTTHKLNYFSPLEFSNIHVEEKKTENPFIYE